MKIELKDLGLKNLSEKEMEDINGGSFLFLKTVIILIKVICICARNQLNPYQNS